MVRIVVTVIVACMICTPSLADLVVPTERVTSNVKIREEQRSTSMELGTLRPGESLEWIRNIGRWREVRIDPTHTGFVSRSFTRRIPDDPNFPDGPLPDRDDDELRIHFLPIGAGSCTIVECPGSNARPMIVDCGSLNAGARGPGDLDEAAASTAVKAILAGKPDPNVVISHPDKDHMSYMGSILDTVQGSHIWLGGEFNEYETGFRTLVGTQDANGAHIHTDSNTIDHFHNDQFEMDDHLSCGDASVFILTVHSGEASTGSKPNADSLVLSIDYNEFSVVLAGDAEAVTESQALENYDGAVKTTVIAGSHHGADTQGSNGTTRNFPNNLESDWPAHVFPEVAIYSHGLRFGHPRCIAVRNYHPSLARVPNHPFHCGDHNNDNTPAPRQTTYAEYSTEVSGKITITSDGTSPLSIHCAGDVGCGAEIAH